MINSISGQALNLAVELVDWMMVRYCNSRGLLARQVNCHAGQICDPRSLVDDLGDYAQYVAALGQRLGRADIVNWSLGQVALALEQTQGQDGLVYARNRVGNRLFSALDACDAVWGLAEMYRLLPGAELLSSVERWFAALFQYSVQNDYLTYGCLRLGRSWPIPLTGPMVTGYYAEAALDLAETTGEEKYVAWARRLLLPWQDTPYFKQHGLFPRLWLGPAWLGAIVDWQFRWRGHYPLASTILVKGDTYLMFALLTLYRLTHEAWIPPVFRRWYTALKQNCLTEEGLFNNIWIPSRGAVPDARLVDNHSIIEVLLDAHWTLGDTEYLDLARRCSLAWLRYQTEAGLIPLRPGTSSASLDPQVDFSVDLLKLYQLTSDEAFCEAALRIQSGVIAAHRLPYGLAEKIDIEAGADPQAVTETKFLGLFIKGLLIADAVHRGQNIFTNADLHWLATDR